MTAEEVLTSVTASDWLKAALRGALARNNPIASANEAALLADVLRAEMLDRLAR